MTDRIQPRIPSGFLELLPADQILFERMYEKIKRVYERFGYMPLDTPVLEYSEVLLAKAGGETEKQIFRFIKGDSDYSMRFDLTVPLARYVAMHSPDLVFPFKRYQMQKSFRGERPQKGRFREFYQCDIDTVGSGELDISYDAEILAVIYSVFSELGIGRFVIRLNNRKILNGFFSSLGLSEKAADILRVIDKLDKIGRDNTEKELALLGVSPEVCGSILSLTGMTGNSADKLDAVKGLCNDDEFIKGINELSDVLSSARSFGIPDECLYVDFSIARGLDYYTGTVYETVLTDYPSLGSVCSGGRYDNLTGFYSSGSYPGVGASIGLSRLFYQLREAGLLVTDNRSLTSALVIPMSGEVMGYASSVASQLRASGVNTDIYYGAKSLKQKIKYADRLGIPYAVFIGDDELSQANVTVKTLSNGEQKRLTVGEAVEMIKNS